VGWWVDCGSPHGATTPIRATKPTEHRIDISGPDLFVTRRLGNGRNQGHLLICISPQFSFPRTTITGEHVREPGPDHRTTPRIYICTDGRSDHTPHTHARARFGSTVTRRRRCCCCVSPFVHVRVSVTAALRYAPWILAPGAARAPWEGRTSNQPAAASQWTELPASIERAHHFPSSEAERPVPSVCVLLSHRAWPKGRVIRLGPDQKQ
jgi:hypothetical protein